MWICLHLLFDFSSRILNWVSTKYSFILEARNRAIVAANIIADTLKIWKRLRVGLNQFIDSFSKKEEDVFITTNIFLRLVPKREESRYFRSLLLDVIVVNE